MTAHRRVVNKLLQTKNKKREGESPTWSRLEHVSELPILPIREVQKRPVDAALDGLPVRVRLRDVHLVEPVLVLVAARAARGALALAGAVLTGEDGAGEQEEDGGGEGAGGDDGPGNVVARLVALFPHEGPDGVAEGVADEDGRVGGRACGGAHVTDGHGRVGKEKGGTHVLCGRR